MNFEAASLADDLIVLTSSCNDNSSYRDLAAGFGGRPVQQVLVFSLFFLNNHFERKRILGRAMDARHRTTK